MSHNQMFRHRSAIERSRMIFAAMALLLPLATGCDPCMNNPCNDGIACNGVETCTVDGREAVCGDGVPIACDPPTECTEPNGVCVGPNCINDADCDDSDPCTTDACGDGECSSSQVTCGDGEVCDPSSGNCIPDATGSTGTLADAAGTYGNVSGCGDENTVTLTDNNRTLVLSGLAGNGDITLTPTSDTTATAEGVIAFGNPGHTLTLTLLPSGDIEMTLASSSGSCAVTMTPTP